MRLSPLLTFSLALTFVCGCTNNHFSTGDGSVYFPVVRGTYDVVAGIRHAKAPASEDAPDAEKRSNSPKAFRPSLVAELELDYGRGSSSEHLNPGDSLDFGDKQFNGPSEVDAHYSLSRATLAARGGFWYKEVVGLEGIFGLSGTSLDYRLESGGTSKDLSSGSFGFIVGTQLSARPIPPATIYGRVSFGYGALIGDEVPGAVGMTNLEAGLSVQVVDHFSVFGGWRGWTLGEARRAETDLVLRLHGPIIGLEVGF